MIAWNPLGSFQMVVRAETIDEAGAKLEDALAIGPQIRTIRLVLNRTNKEFTPWFDSARAASPEVRGMMVQLFFARLFSKAGYSVVVGKREDIFATGRFRSLFVEVKSSLKGGKFGSQSVITQLDGYLVASERRRADRWLGTMGINEPMKLHDSFRTEIHSRNIGHLDVRWVSPRETLLPYLPSIP
jgi:hypothetical protein